MSASAPLLFCGERLDLPAGRAGEKQGLNQRQGEKHRVGADDDIQHHKRTQKEEGQQEQEGALDLADLAGRYGHHRARLQAAAHVATVAARQQQHFRGGQRSE